MMETGLMNEKEMARAITRIAHEIIEGNGGVNDLALIGIRRRGDPLSRRIAALIGDFEGVDVPVGTLDITLYRDDLTERSQQAELHGTDIPFDVNAKKLVMIDDVIYTGRTARAAMDAIIDLGRPKSIKLAVMIDRGHRELPIRADYVGKNVPTARLERISVRLSEIDGSDGVLLIRPEQI